jgi:hypothetical protein
MLSEEFKISLYLGSMIKNLMTSFFKGSAVFSLLLLAGLTLGGCKNDDPSIIKIFARSENNEVLNGAQVVVIGDLNSNPATLEYVDTLFTNTSGFAQFNMEPYFAKTGADKSVGYFDVIVKKDGKQGTAYVRCRHHITTVETVFLMN